MTVTRAHPRANDGQSRRERLRRALLGTHDMLTRTPRPRSGGWRTETYGPIPGTGTFRDPRFHDRTARRSR